MVLVGISGLMAFAVGSISDLWYLQYAGLLMLLVQLVMSLTQRRPTTTPGIRVQLKQNMAYLMSS